MKTKRWKIKRLIINLWKQKDELLIYENKKKLLKHQLSKTIILEKRRIYNLWKQKDEK